jgi:glycyl-tRNA synthetase
MNKDNLRFREHEKDELAHYAKACVDVEYKFPFGSGDWQELEGIANRQDFDLRQHQRGMRTMNAWYETRDVTKLQLKEEAEDWVKGPLSYFDDETKERYVPYVIEPSAGIDRSCLAFLVDAYDEMRLTANRAVCCGFTRPWPRSRRPSSRWSKKTGCRKSPIRFMMN